MVLESKTLGNSELQKPQCLSWTSCLQGYSQAPLPLYQLGVFPASCAGELFTFLLQWSAHQEAFPYNIGLCGWLRGASLELVLCLTGVPLSLGFQPHRVQILDVHVPFFYLKFIAGFGVHLSAAANFTIKVFW